MGRTANFIRRLVAGGVASKVNDFNPKQKRFSMNYLDSLNNPQQKRFSMNYMDTLKNSKQKRFSMNFLDSLDQQPRRKRFTMNFMDTLGQKGLLSKHRSSLSGHHRREENGKISTLQVIDLSLIHPVEQSAIGEQ